MNKTLAFDKNTLRLLVSELGAEDAAEVLRAFLEDTRTKIEVLRAVPPDPVLIRREAHSLKSSAGTFGFTALSGLALNVEQNALRMMPDELESAAAALSETFERTADFARSTLLASNMEMGDA